MSATCHVPWRNFRSPSNFVAVVLVDGAAGFAAPGFGWEPRMTLRLLVLLVIDGLRAVFSLGATATLGPGFAGQSIHASNPTTNNPPPAENPINMPRLDGCDVFRLTFSEVRREFDPPVGDDFPPRDFSRVFLGSSSQPFSAKSPRSHSSSDDAFSTWGLETRSGIWHAGHFTRRPAYSSFTERALPHSHCSLIAILIIFRGKPLRRELIELEVTAFFLPLLVLDEQNLLNRKICRFFLVFPIKK